MKNLKVILGAVDVNHVMIGGCTQDLSVRTLKIHDAFNSKTLANDVALLRLTNSIPANNCSCTLCLPEPWTGPLRIDSKCFATGYGLSSTSSKFTTFQLSDHEFSRHFLMFQSQQKPHRALVVCGLLKYKSSTVLPVPSIVR